MQLTFFILTDCQNPSRPEKSPNQSQHHHRRQLTSKKRIELRSQWQPNSEVVAVVNRRIRRPHQNHRFVLLVANRLGKIRIGTKPNPCNWSINSGANTVKRLEKIGIQSVLSVKHRAVGFHYNKPDLLKTREQFFVEVALRGTLPTHVPNVVRKLLGWVRALSYWNYAYRFTRALVIRIRVSLARIYTL